jgi:hypothetical protein
MKKIVVVALAFAISLVTGQVMAKHGASHGGGNQSRVSVGIIENLCELDADTGMFSVQSLIANKSSGGHDVIVTLKRVTAQYKKKPGSGQPGNKLHNIASETCTGAFPLSPQPDGACDPDYPVDPDTGEPINDPLTGNPIELPPPIVIAAGEAVSHTQEFNLCPSGYLIDPAYGTPAELQDARALNAAVNITYGSLTDLTLLPRSSQTSQCTKSKLKTDLEYSDGGLKVSGLMDFCPLPPALP